LKIITYPHPTLRHPSKPIRRMDAALRDLIREMFDLMYAANGIGLAANQVDLPLRLFVCNPAGHPEEGDEWVLLNPVLSRPKGQSEREEGCLSLPGLYAPVRRPEAIHLEAYGLDGQPISLDLEGLMARVVQHETDHLDGVLFTDRVSTAVGMDLESALYEFQVDFESRRSTGEERSDAEIAERLAEIERQYAVQG